MKKIFFLILASYLLLNIALLGQTGQAGLTFLKLGVSGRALGMGEAYTAIASDPSATYYNPAALSLSKNSQLLLMHKEWIQDMKTEFIGATTIWEDFSFGLSVNTTSFGDLELRSIAGPSLGTFTPRYASIGISTAYELNSSISLGLTGKFLYEKIFVDDASGYALDLGVLYHTPWDVQLAFVINNIGSMNALQIESTKLPATIRGGAAYERKIESVDGRLTFSTDVVSFIQEKKTHLHMGTEFDYKNLCALRLGYQTGYNTRDISVGLGLHYNMFHLDYAFVPFRDNYGTTHTISIGIEFE